MLEKIFDSPTRTMLNKALDAASLRNKVVANNIANVDTPKFKRSEVIFEDKLKNVLEITTNNAKLKVTNPKHIQFGSDSNYLTDLQPDIVKINDTSYRNDENNVDIDTEVAAMTKNSLYYDAVSESINNEIRLLRLAITGKE